MKEITESNRLIAEFMGYVLAPNTEKPLALYTDDEHGFRAHCRFDKVKYHASYDWLMPVWVKIREIIEDNIDRNATLCWYDTHQKSISHAILNYEIKIVFDRIVRFIQWYNQQQTDK